MSISSYVYIRLVLLTMLAWKIQRTIFSIAVFPTVTNLYSHCLHLPLVYLAKQFPTPHD